MQRNMPKAISRNPPLNMNMMEAFFRQGNCALQIICEYLVSEYALERAETGWHVLLQESPRSPNNATHQVTVLAEHGRSTTSRKQALNRLSGRNSGGGIVVTRGFEFSVSENVLPTAKKIAIPPSLEFSCLRAPSWLWSYQLLNSVEQKNSFETFIMLQKLAAALRENDCQAKISFSTEQAFGYFTSDLYKGTPSLPEGLLFVVLISTISRIQTPNSRSL